LISLQKTDLFAGFRFIVPPRHGPKTPWVAPPHQSSKARGAFLACGLLDSGDPSNRDADLVRSLHRAWQGQ